MQENQSQSLNANFHKSFEEFLRNFNDSEETINVSNINKFGLSLNGFDLCVTELTHSYFVDQSLKEFDAKSNLQPQMEAFPQSPKMCKPWKLEEKSGDNFDLAMLRLDEIIKLLSEKIDATERIIRHVKLSKNMI